MRRLAATLAVTSLVLATTPAIAADDATKAGVVAALGLEASKGTTKLESGAGSIEAGLLNSDAIRQAGSAIRQIVQQAKASYYPGNKRVLVVGRDEKADFTMVRWVSFRIRDLDRTINGLPTCKSSGGSGAGHGLVVEGDPATGRMSVKVSPGSGLIPGLPLTVSDLGAAIGTDIDIANVPLSSDDRMLIDAVAMPTYPGKTHWKAVPTNQALVVEKGYAPSAEAEFGFVLPSEIANVEAGNPLLAHYDDLVKDTLPHRICNDDDAKAAVKAVDDFVATVNKAPDKGVPPLTLAAELSALADEKPLLLRLAIEQVGGTATTRTSIWYSLGYPGAATVGAGILASFRLVDQITGKPLAAGFVRCVVDQQNIRKIHQVLDRTYSPASCSYVMTS